MRLPEDLDIDIYCAMEEYDESPREFLRKHGYGQAKEYWILAWDDGRPVLYPSKAILGVAMKRATGIRPGMSGSPAYEGELPGRPASVIAGRIVRSG